MNEKEKIKHEFYFHFKDIYDKDSSIYEDSYLRTYQINWKLERLEEEKNKMIFLLKSYYNFFLRL